MEKINSRACRFAEWLQENRWFLFHQGKWNYSFERGTSISEASYNEKYRKTTEELYAKFCQENDSGETKGYIVFYIKEEINRLESANEVCPLNARGVAKLKEFKYLLSLADSMEKGNNSNETKGKHEQTRAKTTARSCKKNK